MKHSPESHEPDRIRDAELHGSASGDSPEGYSGSDSEISRAEEALFAAMGRSVAGGLGSDALDAADAELGPDPAFEARLRERFLSGSLAEAAGAGAHDRADERLRAWVPEAPRDSFASELRASFLQAAADSAAATAPSVANAVSAAGPSVTRHERTSVRSRQSGSPPSPARSSRLRLVGAGTLLAAAAAVIVFLQRPSDVVEPGAGEPGAGEPNAGEFVADAAASREAETPGESPIAESAPAWQLDTTFGDTAALLASVRIDGESVASVEEFGARMASAARVESSGFELRLRHREEFVLELAEDTGIRLDAFRPAAESKEAGRSEPSLIRADFGGVRVATGPDFDPSTPLVLETPHVRTEVVGTVFGLDIGEDYTCVCCLEGAVETTSMQAAHPALRVAAEHTSVFMDAKDRPPVRVPMVGDHREPLERLSQYWS
ncbi:MAG: hypothetical protein AAGG01_11295 [Planctomycetota bacterium]